MTELPAPPILENVHGYLTNELIPLKKELFEFWDEVAQMKVDAREALLGRKLARLTLRLQQLTSRWRTVRQKVVDLDTFIDADDPKALEKLGAWMQNPVYKNLVETEEAAVSSVMRDITESIRGLRMEADFKRSGFLSVSAITIGTASLLTTLILNLL